MEGYFWPLIFILIGVLLLVLEMFIPSAGALGVFAAIAFFAAVIFGFAQSSSVGAVTLMAIAVIIPAFIASFIHWWPKTPLGRRMLLKRSQEEQESLTIDDDEERLRALIGKRGRAKTVMLPAGAVTVDGQTYDALTEGLAVEPGQPVEVISLRFHRLVVRPIENDATPLPELSLPPTDPLSQTFEDFGLDDLDLGDNRQA